MTVSVIKLNKHKGIDGPIWREVSNIGHCRPALCYKGLSRWFDIPDTCNYIEVKLSNKPCVNSYRIMLYIFCTTTVLIYDERAKCYIYETLTNQSYHLIRSFLDGKPYAYVSLWLYD
jgi:hypothetical protein